MLVRIPNAPGRTVALEASGTVVASDVDQALAAALEGGAPTGLVVVIGRDFDGYFAELARGLSNATATHAGVARIAVVADADRIDEANLAGFGASVPLRLFPASERSAAFAWAAAEGGA